MRVMRHWNRLLTEVVDVQVFKDGWDSEQHDLVEVGLELG